MKTVLPFNLVVLAVLLATTEGSVVRAAGIIDYGSLQSLFDQPVTTNVTGTPQLASKVAADMTIITADQIRQSGVRSIPQIVDIYVPGIDLLREGPTGYDIGVRGFQQPFQTRLLVLVDGRQVFIDDYSRTSWDNIPVNVDDIRQIEVVKGASSALFGSNAANGVINIITYSPLYDNNRVASLSVGTQSTLEGDTTVTAKGDWGGTKFSAGGLNMRNFSTSLTVPPDFATPKDPQKRYALNSTIFDISPTVKANTEATYSQSTSQVALPQSFNLVDQTLTTYSLRAGVDWQTPYGKITNNNYWNHSYAELSGVQPVIPVATLSTDLIVSQLEDEFRTGNEHTFQITLEYRDKEFNNNVPQILPESPALSETNFAVGGTWLWQINDKWSWTNALRGEYQGMDETGSVVTGLFSKDDYDHAKNTWSANSGLAYTASDMDTLRVTYGRGIVLPSLLQTGFFGTFALGPLHAFAEGNPEIKPTVVQTYELAYDRKLPQLSSTAKVSLFYEKDQDIIVAPPFTAARVRLIGGVPYVVSIEDNGGNAQGWGGEVELLGSSTRGFRWNASYSLSRVSEDPGVASAIDYSSSAPEHHFRLNVGYTRGPWELDLNGRYVTSTQMFHPTLASTNGYTTVSGRVGFNITDGLTFAISAVDLNHPYIQESPYQAVEREVLATLTGRF